MPLTSHRLGELPAERLLGVGTTGCVASVMGFQAAGTCSATSRNARLTNPFFYRQDAQIAGQATGAMSFAFIAALKKNSQQSYVQLLNSIRDELEGKYSQKPQLSCSHPLGKSLGYLDCGATLMLTIGIDTNILYVM